MPGPHVGEAYRFAGFARITSPRRASRPAARSAASRPELADRRGGAIERWFDGSVDAKTNVEHDEAILASGGPAARVGVLVDTSVSVGVAQRPETVAALAARRWGFPVVRRASGGTGVLHMVGDLTWSIVLPRTHPLVGNDFVRAYPRLGAGVVRFLAGLDIESEWARPFGVSDTFCLLGSRGQVLTVDGHAIGGAAQHLTRDALLHQGVVSYRIDRRLLDEIFGIDDPMVDRYLTSLRGLGVTEGADVLGAQLLDDLVASLSAPDPPAARHRAARP